jgi:hypothetical protein
MKRLFISQFQSIDEMFTLGAFVVCEEQGIDVREE